MRILFVEEVDSTQRVAIEWVLQNRREWDAICADHQTAGRGRRGSQWYDEPGASLLVSLVLWDVPLPEPPGLLGVMAAIATAESLEATFAPLQVQLKYPNDLIVHGRKLGGVLVEIADSVAVVGVGVNLTQRSFPEPLREHAISVWQALEPTPPLEGSSLRAPLIERIGTRLKQLTTEVAQRGITHLYALWQSRDVTPGRLYCVLDLPDQPIATALRVEPDFRLRLRLPDGSEYATYLVHALS
jgi:BirA family transcriptional regulator, biotin operon repressor / biotin---[acetyl-CoA-carboxylase] ligase